MSEAALDQVAEAAADAILTKLQAALVVSCTQRTVERGLADGSLPSLWRNGRRLIRVSDLRAWDERRRARVPKSAAGAK